MRVWTGFLVGWVAACGGAVGSQHEVAFPEFHRKLTNGIRLVVLPDATTSLAEIDVRYEVGSREDPPGKAGLAHLVEHLMFQQHQAGPDKPPIAAVFRTLGIYSNAYTNWDSTHYETLAQAERAEDLVALEVARLETGCQSIDAETFAREREVVRNEIRTRLGTPEAQVDYLLLESVYPQGHPYRQMIGGDDQQLAAITIDDVCKFMHDYYVPERVTFIVAGGVSPDLEKRLLPILGPVPARSGAPRAQVAPIQLGGERVEAEMDVEETSVFATWAMPSQASDDWTAAIGYVGELAGRAAVFGDIYEFATDVSVHVIGGAEAPVLVVEISVADPQQVDEAVAALRRAAGGLRKQWIDVPTELRNHRARLAGAALYQLDGLAARTEAFADFVQFRGIKYTLPDEIERGKRYDPDRVSQIGRDILDPAKAKLIVVTPKKGAPRRLRRAALGFLDSSNQPDELPVDRNEAAHAIPLPPPSSSNPAAQPQTFVLDNGLRVVLLPARMQLPLVTVALSFRSGSSGDPVGKEGLAVNAVQRLSAPRGGYELGYVGAQGGRYVTADQTVFFARSLSLYLDNVLLGIERTVAAGNYSPEYLDAWQRRAAFALKRPSHRAERAFSRVWRQAVFGDHPYARDGEPTEKSVSEVDHDSLLSYRDRVFGARNATLVVSGSFNVEHATSLIRQRLGDLRSGSPAPALPPVMLSRSKPRFVGVEADHLEMMPLSIAYPVDRPLEGSFAARLVLADMLTHRVRVIREKLGASYGVYASLLTFDGAGAYVIRGSVDPLRAGQSLRTLREAVATLRRGDDFLEEFVRARRRVLNGRLIAATSTLELAERAVWSDRYGRPVGFEDDLVRTLASLTPREVMTVMQSEMSPQREVVVALGKKALLAKAFAEAGIDDVDITSEP